MKDRTRRSIAYIIGSTIADSGKSTVYDYLTSKHYAFSGSISREQVSAYDHTESCHVSGSLPSLYHYGNSAHISIQMNGNNFTGYDYDEGVHFSGTVSGNNVSIYDYGKSSYFNYSL